MRLTKRCEHGLKAAVQLALHENEGYLQAKEIASREDLPGKFIESILSALRESSLLISKVGARGGYKLARPASQITVASIIEALEIDHDDNSSGDAQSPTPGNRAMRIIQHRIDDAIERTFGMLTLEVLAREERETAPMRVEIKPYSGYAQGQAPAAQDTNGVPRLVLHSDEREAATT